MASGGPRVRRLRRPAILDDMEGVLVCNIRRSLQTGNVVTKPDVKTMAKEIFLKLRGSGMYDLPGERNARYGDWSVYQIHTFIDGIPEFVECHLCYGYFMNTYYAMEDHIRQAHSGLAHGVPQERPAEAPYRFYGSDGWLHNFLRKHPILHAIYYG